MEQSQYQFISGKIKTLLGIDLQYYKDVQMKRRLESWLSRSGKDNWDDFFEMVEADEEKLTKFRNFITINVSEFYRDIERWNSLQEDVMPMLLDEANQSSDRNMGIRIWSAGASIGAEPYTLSMILSGMAPMKDHYILASDIDRKALAQAKEGGPYLESDIRNVSGEIRTKFFKNSEPPYYVKDNLKKIIKFQEHDLFNSPFETEFDLIVCRNVVIYFTTESKDILYKKFARSLRMGGILFLGGTEIIPRPQEFGLRNHGVSFYKKVQEI